jgi:tetratricopeptide (TPR) repeat protein
MSDRSVHAATIRESVVVTGDGNTVVANFGATSARLSLQRRQVRPIDRRRTPRPGEPPRELDLFAPDTEVLPLLGRDQLLQQLRTWLYDTMDLSVHGLIGQAGSGKTRLALELCRTVDPPDGSGLWRAAFVTPSALDTIVETLVTRQFEWDRPTLLVLDYAATAYRALARWLDALSTHRQTPKLRFLLLEREAPDQFGWWHELAHPASHSEASRADLFWQPRPSLLPDLADLHERHTLLLAAQQAAHRLRGGAGTLPRIPPPDQDNRFDRALAAPRFGNPLNLVMAGIIACDQSPLGALGLRRLDAAGKLAERERQRLATLARARNITQPVIQHIVAFNGLAGGLPVADLPDLVASELTAWGTPSDPQAIAALLDQEFPPRDAPAESPRLGTIQPDLIGESVIVQSFEGEHFLPAQAAPTVRRAYALGRTRAAEALVRIVQDFAYALEDQTSSAAERTRGTAVLGWLTELAEQTTDPTALLPLVFALPAQTLVLREPSLRLTQALSDTVKNLAEASEDHDVIGLSAVFLNNLAIRLSGLGRREDALTTAAEAVHMHRALADARPDAFTADLALSLNNLANMLSDLGRREDAFTSAEEAVHLYRALADARPDAFTANLALSLNNLANMLSDLGRREDALTTAEEAVRLYRALADARPDAFTADLAGSLNNLANRLSDLGRREDALTTAEEAVRLRRALADARPDAFTADLARSLWVLGDLQAETGDRDARLATLAEGVCRLTPVFDAYPAATRDVMIGLARSYLQQCEQANIEPDAVLLAPVVAILQRLKAPDQP